MRNSSQILIFVDIQKALDAGVKFYLSTNGVVLTEGDEQGYLLPRFFSRVETHDRKPLPGWDGPKDGPRTSLPVKPSTETAPRTTQQGRTAPVDMESEAKVEASQAPLSAVEEGLVQKLESTGL